MKTRKRGLVGRGQHTGQPPSICRLCCDGDPPCGRLRKLAELAAGDLFRSGGRQTDCIDSTEGAASRVAGTGFLHWFHAGGEGASPPVVAAKSGADGPAPREKDGVLIGEQHRCHCCAERCAAYEADVAVEFNGTNIDCALMSRARDCHLASHDVGARLRAESVRFSNDEETEETIDDPPAAQTRPARSHSPGAKNEASASSVAAAAWAQKEEPECSGAGDAASCEEGSQCG